jgi:hypothetical protein
VDESVVEGGEDAGNSENELTYSTKSAFISPNLEIVAIAKIVGIYVPSRIWGPREMFSSLRSTFFPLGAILLIFAGIFGTEWA